MNSPIFLACFLVFWIGWTGEANSLPTPTDMCLLPGVTGFCRAGFRRYYYNAVLEKCLLFTYGGCGGNRNNFGSKSECISKCGCVKVCPSIYKPVCATDGKTYQNACALEIVKCRSSGAVLLHYEGECEK